MTNDEKLAAIKNHIEADRASSPDGKTSWDRIEDFRLKHGHLPSVQSAPCPNCFQERTDALIKLKARPTPSQDREAVFRELLRELHAIVKGECPSLLNEDSGGFAELDIKITAALTTHPKKPSQDATRLEGLEGLAKAARPYLKNEIYHSLVCDTKANKEPCERCALVDAFAQLDSQGQKHGGEHG